jgi:hypothetical protein
MIGLSRRLPAVTAAAMCAGTLFLPPLAPAAAAPSADAAGILAACEGNGCTGRDPEAAGCARDAITARIAESPEGVIVELRYSATCRAAWGRIREGRPGDRVRVHNSNGQNRVKTIQTGRSTYTAMVNDKNILAWACIRVTISQSLTCTGRF